MVESEVRHIRKRRYLIPLIFTLAIFILGVFVGLFVDEKRVSLLEESIMAQQYERESLRLRYEYLDLLLDKKEECVSTEKALQKSIEELGELGRRLEGYSTTTYRNDPQFLFLKRDYTLTEIKYWLLLNNLNEKCNVKSVPILYFYSINNCPSCDTQGNILNHLNYLLDGDLRIFSLDYDFKEEPIIDLIKKSYDIKSTPTLVIGDQKEEGLVSEEALLKIICKKTNNKYEQCSS